LTQEEVKIIERYINGEANEKEREYVESLLASEDSNLYLSSQLSKDWDLMQSEKVLQIANTSQILDRIHHSINKLESKKTRRPHKRFLRVYMKIAGIILIPIVISSSLIFNHLSNKYFKNIDKETVTSLYAPFGSRVSFKLPDGTSGMLNGGSTLSYSVPFTQNRLTKLKGEAWLEVAKDEKSPFIIDVGNSLVKVIGTSFNISAYPNDNYVEVVLAEGQLEFKDKIYGQREIVEPFERISNTGGQLEKSFVEPYKYSSWTKGKLIFNGDYMDEVAKRIERWYNVKVFLADNELLKYSFHATFEDEKLEDIIKYLSMTSPISYKILPRKILPDGSLKKQEVIIYKNR